MNKLQVLVIDDEWNVRNLLRIYLAKNGFEVMEAKNGYEGVRLAEQQSFDLIILDVMMPDMDGWEVCKKIRETKDTPILMLTARTDTKDKVKGLTMGADDYLVKPFDSDELIARVFALLRRSSISQTTTVSRVITNLDLTIDPEGRQVLVREQPIDLTPKEFELLFVLAENPRRAFERENLLEKVWGGDYFGDFRTVDTHVKNIREKVRKAELSFNPIQTVWGVGYKFQWTDERK
ncbi:MULTISPECIES: response regulator transcription factor [Bacillati]|uniref:Response regulator transcription factor n=1 Tax=Niallia taxi TaxID=2499688 RepID=A0A3S2UDW6_9BACI|nr:response regulator transcription factor [Niallia taxi]MDK8642992.1 response regulator transcription factor [Niallia taxi]MED4038256.1 response regulator transcription factor [Niallia taxi]MED4055149.1 response regulator transcription factor [Niallia taxi]MED4120661.1 response regulator transcription factor [Niallia taxi]RVT59414.1 response regulator transcription factor [Niallia taxi]